jgi:hypothetical protein
MAGTTGDPSGWARSIHSRTMGTLLGQLRNVQDALDALARRHRVPGATLAVGVGDERFDFATGMLNVDTG